MFDLGAQLRALDDSVFPYSSAGVCDAQHG